ncbi:citron Rho-interacting kinase-like [Photinus pyralis]|nr:citron Rho-interacting kinase-like [Photinus pyralis]
MEPSKDPISARTAQLNSNLLSTKTSNSRTNLLNRDGLLDALTVLYDESNNDCLKKFDRHIGEFVTRHRGVVNELRCLRVNVSDFEVKNVIGRGHFGEVFVVKEKQTGDVHAMKMIRKSDCLRQKHISYEEERDIMVCAKSVWLTRLQYAFQDANNLYFVMEYFPGGDLSGLLQRQGGTVPESAASFYLAELVLAVHDLHTMGYVHRDIKPENILLDRCGHIKLADFGSSARLDSRGFVNEGVPVGTPDYIAPEVLQCMDSNAKKMGYQISCDYWSIGVLAYHLTVGSTPFSDPNTAETYSKIMNYTNGLKFPPDIVLSQSFVSFVKCLLCDATKRLNYETALKHPLFKNIDFNGIRDQVPPYVPKIESNDDTSNFCDVPRKKNEPNIDNFKTKTQFSGKNLPFVGFTFTRDVCDLKYAYDSKSERSVTKIEEELQNELKALQRQLMKSKEAAGELQSLERKVAERGHKLESLESLRNKLERDLANSIAECGALKRTLELERKDRLNLEHKALELIKSAKQKWENSEKTKVDGLKLEVAQQKEKIQQLASTNALLNEQLQHALQMQHKHKDSIETVEHLNRKSIIGLETRLEKITLETQNQMSAIESKLRDETHQKNLLQTELSACRASERSLSEKLKASEENCGHLLIKLESNQKTIRELEYKIEILGETAKTIDEQKAKTRALEDEMVKLRNEKVVAEWEQKFKVEKEANANLQKQIKELKEELNTSIASRNSLVEQQKLNYNQHLKEVQDQLSRTLEEANQLEVKLQEAKSVELNTKLKVQTLEDLLQRLESGVSKLESDSDKESVLKEQVARLEAQLIEVHETLALDRQELGQLKTKFWRVEKDLGNAEIDKRIFKRELKETEEKNRELGTEIESLKGAMAEKIGVYESALTEVGAMNEDLANEIVKLKEVVRYMEERFKDEKEKSNSDQNVIDALKSEIKGKEALLVSKAHEIEMWKREKDESCRIVEALRQEKCNLERLLATSDKAKSTLQGEVDGCRRELQNTQINLQALREACTLLENQLVEYENLHVSFESQRKSYTANTDKLIKELAASKEQVQETKRMVNEERSLKLIAETHCRRLMEDIECLQKESSSYKQQCVDFRQYSSTLTDEVSSMEEKIADYEVTVKSYERQITNLIAEGNLLQEENSELLTNLNCVKDSNFKLGLELADAKKANADLSDAIGELEALLQQKINYQKERELKADSTIQQQIKLIDFLQCKIEDNKRKKTLSDKLFGNSKKENQPPPIPLNYKDLENMLLQERDTSKTLREEISRLNQKQNGTLSPRTKTTMEKLTRPPTGELSRQNSCPRMYHNIPHRFESRLCTKATKCAQCGNTVPLGRNLKMCGECHLAVHPFCAPKLPKTCGVPRDYVKHYSETITHLQEEKEVPVTDDAVDVEGWVKIPVRGNTAWERHYACLTPTTLKMYSQPPTPQLFPVETIELKSPNSHGIVILEPVASEIHAPIAASDLPFVIKLQVNSSCWPPKHVTLMTLNANDKEKWSKALTSIYQTQLEKYEGEVVLKYPQDLSLNCLVDLNATKLLGTEQGLYSYNEQGLVHIAGPLQVYQVLTLPSINACMMIADSTRALITCNLYHLASMSRAAPCSNPTLMFKSVKMNNLHGFHLFDVSAIGGNLALSAATSKQLVIAIHDRNLGEFVPVRILDTAEPTGCLLFTEHSLIVGANKYFEIDLNTFEAEEFLDLSDKKLCQVMMCYEAGSFPIGIIKISDKPIEYLLCFNEIAVFVDEYGRHSRKAELKWNRLPQAFHYHAPYLHVVQFASVEIIKITPDTCNRLQNSVDSLLNTDCFTLPFSSVQHLGRERRGVYIACAGEVRYLEGRKVDPDGASLSDEGDDVDEIGSDNNFSFTSSMVRSLDGNLSDAETTDSGQSEDYNPKKKVTFDSRTTPL